MTKTKREMADGMPSQEEGTRAYQAFQRELELRSNWIQAQLLDRFEPLVLLDPPRPWPQEG